MKGEDVRSGGPRRSFGVASVHGSCGHHPSLQSCESSQQSKSGCAAAIARGRDLASLHLTMRPLFAAFALIASASAAELTSIPFKTIKGKDTSLADYKGKVVLVVNTASKCGLTPQYEAL